MKLKYLGTAAAEGIPGLWCNCELCQKAKKLGGKDIRTRSQVLLDDSLLIDFPPDTLMHLLSLKKTLFDTKDILITHMHDDHMYPIDMFYKTPGYAYNNAYEKTNIYASQYTLDFFKKFLALYGIGEDRINSILNLVPLKPYQEYEIAGYKVVPFEAEHATGTDAYIYLISKDNKTILYGNDTGIWKDKVDEYLSSHNIHIDLLSLDCTKGATPASYNCHMNMDEAQVIVDRLKGLNVIDKSTKKVFTHFSHNCQMTHAELIEEAKKYDFEVAFDGLEICF